MIFYLLIAALLALDVLALMYGVDSREGLERDPKGLGLPR